jgi:Zn-dependent protease
MILTLAELGDIVIMTAAIGYIFMDMFKRTSRVGVDYDPLKFHVSPNFDFEAFKFSCFVVAPGIVLHELGHKFAALMLGLSATLHASLGGLALGIALKLMHFGFIIFVPGYVAITGGTPLQGSITAFAGPFTNLMLFVIPVIILRYGKGMKHRTRLILLLTKRINLFLFIFNMLPFGFFDGAKVFEGLRIVLFG